MKKIIFIILPIVLIVFSSVLISCDILLPAPLGRNNPFDYEAQIGRFNAAASGSDSIVTNWDWHDALSGISDNRVIDKIRIVHQQNNRPGSKYPLNPDNVQEYTSTADWSYNWTGLKNDRDHWFALYAHEKGGQWLSPKYTEYSIDSSIPDNNATLFPFSPSSDSTQFIVANVGDPFPPTDETFNSTYSCVIGKFLVLEFNIYESIYFDQFLLHLKNNVPGSDVNLTIYTLKKNLDRVFDWTDMISDSTIDYNSAIIRQVTIAGGADQVIDISEIVNRVSQYYSQSIAISVNNSLTVDIGSWYIDAHYWGKN